MSRLERRANSATLEVAEEPLPATGLAAAFRRNRGLIIFGALAFLLALAVYVLRIDKVVGMFVDDAWYVLLAKALATGQGYTLINSPTPGIVPLYPPAFPAILSMIFRIAPDFPQNLWLLKSVSVAAMLIAGVVAFYYFTRVRELPGYLAMMIALAMVLTPPLVFLAASTVMAECVYLLFLLTAITMIDRAVSKKDDDRALWLLVAAGAVFSSLAFLTRSFGIIVILAAVIFLFKSRRLKAAIGFIVITAALCGPWVIYSRLKAPTLEQRLEQESQIVVPSTEQFWLRNADAGSSATVSASDLPDRVWKNVVQITGRDVGRILMAPVTEAISAALAEQQGSYENEALTLSFLLTAFVITGFVIVVRRRLTLAEIVVALSLLLTVILPWDTFRFVASLTPFLLFYFLIGCTKIYHLHLRLREEPRKPGWPGLAVLAGVLAAVSLAGHAYYFQKKFSSNPDERPVWTRMYEENQQILDWVNERAPEGSVVATPNPALVHLLSGKKTISAIDPVRRWDVWTRVGARYLAYVSALRVKDPDYSESRYLTVLEPKGSLNLRIVDLGPPEQYRERWGVVIPRGIIK